jgi:hypothetical protein
MPTATNLNLPKPLPTSAPQSRIPPGIRAAPLLISALLLLPCFWHPHIEAGDLGSHLYNAWLAQLVQQGKAPGIYIAAQWHNVLFDLLLFHLANLFGLALAEKLAVSLCVLIFFWGLFALMKTVSSQSPWFLSPVIAMLSYGYIFHMGFLNYYLSLGLACIGLSLVWHAHRLGLLVALLLSPLMLLAHPLGLLFFFGAAAYRLLWRKLPGASKLLLPAGAIAACLTVRWFIARHPAYEVGWRETPLWQMTGADQFHVFNDSFSYISFAIAILALLSTALAALHSPRPSSFLKDRRLLLELYLVSFSTAALLPENLHTDPTTGWIGALASRLTLVTAIFGLCWLASLPPRTWHLLAYSAVAIFFFVFLYQDTAFLNRMEANTERLTHELPFGTRALSSVFAPNTYRTMYIHIPDRACIGHCFLVSNYEPPTRMFRVRVQQGSPVSTFSVDDSEDMQSGTYDVQPEDLPLKQIYQCDPSDLTRICIRDLSSGEQNNRLGFRP